MAPIPYKRSGMFAQGGRQMVKRPRVSAIDKAINTVAAIVNPVGAIAGHAGSELRKRLALPAPRQRTRTVERVVGQSGGKFPTRKKRNTFAKYTKRGIVATKEVGTVVTGSVNSYPIYAGHVTHGDLEFMTKNFFRCLVRNLFNKAGIQITSLDSESVGSGLSINVLYQQDDADGGDSLLTQTTAGFNYNQIANNLASLWDGVLDTLAGQRTIFITSVQLVDNTVPATPYVLASQNYRDAYVTVHVKSDMKLQNRTLAVGTDDDINSTENVSNQPLYGKSYTGTGTGVISTSQIAGANDAKSLICNDYGAITFAPGGGSVGLQEPPLPTQFTPRPKYAKASLEPGHVKTSTLTATWRSKQTDFWKMFTLPALATQELPNNRYGKFRIFALEKMLSVSATDTNPSLGMEINCRMGLIITFPSQKNVNEIYDGQQYI